MQAQIWKLDDTDVAVVEGPGIVIRDAQDALDLLASLLYDYGCTRVAIDKAAIAEDFFRLRTGLAGEILQKFTNFRFAVAIFGDFSPYRSQSLRDFICECNRGRQVYFAADREQAIAHLRRL